MAEAGERARRRYEDDKVLLVMVGLPARGKSYIAHKVVDYFAWHGISVDIFNVGKYRRESTDDTQAHDFFDAGNENAQQQREEMAETVLKSTLDWLNGEGQVAIFDATNTTNQRRNKVLKICARHSVNVNVVFIESICDDPAVIESNLRQKIQNSPDYNGLSPEEAMADLRQRVKNYEKVYETIKDDRLSYIKLINLRSKIVCNRIHGEISHRIVSFLMSIHIGRRPIYLTRAGHVTRVPLSTIHQHDGADVHGFSAKMLNDISMSIATTSSCTLNEDGETYAEHLTDELHRQLGDQFKDLLVYTSTLPRATQTADKLGLSYSPLSALNTLDTGVCHGLTVAEIQSKMPQDWEKFHRNPFSFRIPGGESFSDLVTRLDPFIIEMERQETPILTVSHLNTLQTIYGYLLGQDIRKYLRLHIPTNTMIKLTPSQYGYTEERIELRK